MKKFGFLLALGLVIGGLPMLTSAIAAEPEDTCIALGNELTAYFTANTSGFYTECMSDTNSVRTNLLALPNRGPVYALSKMIASDYESLKTQIGDPAFLFLVSKRDLIGPQQATFTQLISDFGVPGVADFLNNPANSGFVAAVFAGTPGSTLIEKNYGLIRDVILTNNDENPANDFDEGAITFLLSLPYIQDIIDTIDDITATDAENGRDAFTILVAKIASGDISTKTGIETFLKSYIPFNLIDVTIPTTLYTGAADYNQGLLYATATQTSEYGYDITVIASSALNAYDDGATPGEHKWAAIILDMESSLKGITYNNNAPWTAAEVAPDGVTTGSNQLLVVMDTDTTFPKTFTLSDGVDTLTFNITFEYAFSFEAVTIPTTLYTGAASHNQGLLSVATTSPSDNTYNIEITASSALNAYDDGYTTGEHKWAAIMLNMANTLSGIIYQGSHTFTAAEVAPDGVTTGSNQLLVVMDTDTTFPKVITLSNGTTTLTFNITFKYYTAPYYNGGGGGGGGGIIMDNCPNGDTSPSLYDGTCGPAKDVNLSGEVENNTDDNSDPENTSTSASIEGSTFSNEQNQAYLRAFENGITTIADITKARLSDKLTRAELAKMAVQFAIKILHRTPDTTKDCSAFLPSIKSYEGRDLYDFMITACQLNIMGIDHGLAPLKNFRPDDLVTRAEFGTVFSRILYGNVNNTSTGNYREAHLKALKDAAIITNDNPTLQELRGYIMLMMYRSSQS